MRTSDRLTTWILIGIFLFFVGLLATGVVLYYHEPDETTTTIIIPQHAAPANPTAPATIETPGIRYIETPNPLQTYVPDRPAPIETPTPQYI